MATVNQTDRLLALLVSARDELGLDVPDGLLAEVLEIEQEAQFLASRAGTVEEIKGRVRSAMDRQDTGETNGTS